MFDVDRFLRGRAAPPFPGNPPTDSRHLSDADILKLMGEMRELAHTVLSERQQARTQRIGCMYHEPYTQAVKKLEVLEWRLSVRRTVPEGFRRGCMMVLQDNFVNLDALWRLYAGNFAATAEGADTNAEVSANTASELQDAGVEVAGLLVSWSRGSPRSPRKSQEEMGDFFVPLMV